jgi:eukaryotic-like serine/threonine-protein kinase
MPLSVGDKLGPYEIVAPIGAGGMGEVYRASDTRLGRDVAIKISKDEFSERFAREARSIAALNHSNICHLYDVGPNYLVIEYVEGRELRGPLDFDQALPIIEQLIDGIEAAHEKNIIHRDLKPANIKITLDGVVKILDFGLATAAEPVRDARAATQDSPTFTIGLTEEGTILGTAAYMAPEQAKGRTADKRSDVWSFGVVVYEMFTGKRPFQGESVVETLGAVMNLEPDWTSTPGKIQHLLRSCLQKDPKKRLQAIGDARLLLTEQHWYSPEARRTDAAWIPWAAVAILAVLAVLGWTRTERPPISTLPELSLSIVLPTGKNLSPLGGLSTDRISPDGSAVLYRATDAKYHVRRLSSLQDQPIPAFDWYGDAFWAPDSKSVAFPTVNGLMKMQIPNGALELVTTDTTSHSFRGGSWSDKGTILYAGIDTFSGPIGLYAVPAAGGNAISVEVPGLKDGRYYNPEFLSGGEDFLFAFTPSDSVDAQIFMATLRDGKAADARLLFNNETAAAFTSAGGGRVLFVRNDNLYSQKLDVKARRLIGGPELLQEAVASYADPRKAYFSVSNSGTVAWRSGSAVASQVVIFDRKGNRIGTAGTPVPANIISLSPDEAHVLIASPAGSWVMESNGPGRVSLGSGGQPRVWSQDGSGVIEFRGLEIVQRSLVGGQNTRKLVGSFVSGGRISQYDLLDISGDGRRILCRNSEPPSLLSFSLDEEHQSQLVVEQRVDNAALSPDGAWTVYHPNTESGIYVQSLTSRGLRRQIANSGSWVLWRRDGKEIMYFDQGRIWSVPVDGVGTQLRFAAPEPLFSISRPLGTDSGAEPLAVSHDGSRIFFLQSTEEPDSSVIHVRTGAIR